ncbi:3-oxoacyl-ACP synthase III family protein [Desulfosporosinus youngiae]|uniref:3-oxoacyl-ACP synthase III family protein n=1 Tax=Desulfosporosinus youngiae TaxID=339862 RepID=UPI001FA7486B|nr:ketoacyl-ACP synthase III [Desulfosporosinus youngiae]
MIKGVGIYIPPNRFTSEEVETMAGYEKHGVRHGMVKMITGCQTRHYVSEDEVSSDIASKAALRAMENAGIPPEEIDALLFCSVTQDFAEPATANVVADRLDIRNAYVFDVKNGCNGFLSGMDVADSLIRTGKARTAVVVSGEAISRWVRFDYKSREDLLTGSPVTLSLGDGGGAFILRGEETENKGILKTFFKSMPELWNNNVMWGGGTAFPRDPEKMYIPGTTKPLIDTQVAIADQYIAGMLEELGWRIEDVDFVASSQVAKWIVEKTREKMGVPVEKTSDTLVKWGNVASSNIPLAVYDGIEKGRIKQGSKVILIGGAVGFSSCVMAVQF